MVLLLLLTSSRVLYACISFHGLLIVQIIGIGIVLFCLMAADRRAAKESAVGKLRDLGLQIGLDSITKRVSGCQPPPLIILIKGFAGGRP